METKDEFKEVDIKVCMYYYFDDIMRAWDIDIDTDFSGILLDQKFYKEKNGNVLFISINHNFGKIRIDLFSFLPVLKKLTFDAILIKSVINENKNEYYDNIFF